MPLHQKYLLLFVCAVCLIVQSFGQLKTGPHKLSYNSCGVTASFTPGNDSIIAAPFFNLTFTSTSTNATSLTWYINGLQTGTNTTLNFGNNEPGLYEFKLVAQNGSCTDTALCYYIFPGAQPPNRNNIRALYTLSPLLGDNALNLISTQGGGYLMGGSTKIQATPIYYNTYGSLVKINDAGCIEWDRIIVAGGSGQVNYMVQLADNGFAIAGITDFGQYVMKLDQQGNELWAKNYRFNGSNIRIQCINPTADGGFMMVSPVYTAMGFSWGMIIIRADASGNILWSKFYAKASPALTYYQIGGMLQKGGADYFAGVVDQTDDPSATVQHYTGILMKINDANGQTEWIRNYSQNGGSLYPSDIHSYNNNLLMNGNSANPGIPNANNIFNVLDTAGGIVQSNTISTPAGMNFSLLPLTQAMPQSNGDLYFLNAGPIAASLGSACIFIKLDPQYNLKFARVYNTSLTSGALQYPAVGQDGSFAALGNSSGYGVPIYSTYANKYMFQKIDSSGGWDAAYGCALDSIPVVITPTPVTSQPFAWDTDSVINAVATDSMYNMIAPYGQTRYLCPTEFIDSCSFLKVSGNASVCNLGDTYTYLVHRNGACNEPVSWDISAGVNIITKSDSAVTVQFPAFGYYKIAALLPYACSPVKDSVMVTVASHTGTLNLGPDTSLCPGNTMVLHAGNQFLSYQWQDGSTDSTFTANATGQYWVMATDSCGNLLRDTVNISAAPAVLLNIGPDRTKCNNDTLLISAPGGFLDYKWLPDYNISSDTAQQIIANPAVDTFYILIAEKTPGCFGKDTLHVTVYNSPLINLGNDTSFCSGDSLVLNAGTGFASYQWNTGAATQFITASKQGIYAVKATTTNGCTSADTLQIVNVFPNPVVSLNHDSSLCVGTSRVLDAGNFASYLWNTGSTARNISVNSTGVYSVFVTDKNNCTGSDSSVITTILPLPSAFLPADTSICFYSNFVIRPLANFQSYLWNDNENTPTITISKPGTYWLQVMDFNNCTGTDTINVSQKDCLGGFYVADAFTPNNDGHNDFFKPLILGRVLTYQFTIFNRYGEVVFSTTDTNKGWDGSVSGTRQKTDTYVWVCHYQFDGAKAETKKGTVVLIR
jgi:gliding motility-associated-like protein